MPAAVAKDGTVPPKGETFSTFLNGEISPAKSSSGGHGPAGTYTLVLVVGLVAHLCQTTGIGSTLGLPALEWVVTPGQGAEAGFVSGRTTVPLSPANTFPQWPWTNNETISS